MGLETKFAVDPMRLLWHLFEIRQQIKRLHRALREDVQSTEGGVANVAVGSYASPESFRPLQMSSPSDSSGPSTSEFFLWHITKMLQVRL